MDAFADGARPRAKKTSCLDLCDDADQPRIRADLTTFFGPHADTYLDVYEKMRTAPPKRRFFVRTWSWPVFLVSFTWFFYRKMYAYGALIIIAPIVLGYLFGATTSALPIFFAIGSKGWYVGYALGRIAKADKLGLMGAERTDYLQKSGGVSLVAGIFAGLVFALLAALLILGMAAGRKAGH